MARRASTSEFRTYPWIKSQLSKSSWDQRNPNADPRGQVWEQNEVLAHAELSKGLGRLRPEFVVRITDTTFWTIEAKLAGNIDTACDEAVLYADRINRTSQLVQARFATGVAGNDEVGYEVRTQFLCADGVWRAISADGSLYSEFISQREALRIIAADSPDLSAIPLTVQEVVEIANYVNRRFHSAKVTKERRALLVATILLALEKDPDLSYKNSPSVFVADLNSRARAAFDGAGKLALWERLSILPEGISSDQIAPLLADILQKLKTHDILHTARSTDLLGTFFESFLRYGNTSKDLGIVLTPRHLCWLAAEAVGITKDDVVYDPAVGTGGFLVAAFNRVTALATPGEAENFASSNIYGVEHSDHVAALAFVNMYFRGDGKHNLTIGSSLQKRLVTNGPTSKPTFLDGIELAADEHTVVTKVLMNPPFALPDANESETSFIDAGLRQLVRNGVLFSVLPSSVLYDSQFASWRTSLLERHSVIAVIALPIDLFYPVATESVGIVLKKGRTHDVSDRVLWARISDDGFVKRKGYRVERKDIGYKAQLGSTAAALNRWIASGVESPTIPGDLEYMTLSHSEWLPQTHLGTGALTNEDFEAQVRESYRQISGQLIQLSPFPTETPFTSGSMEN